MKNKFFKLYYNPKIIGAKNIPSNGPVILCGNHLNPLDYKLVSCATKRNIVWYKQNNLEEVKKELKNNGIVGIFPEKVINIYRLLQIDIMLLEQEINKINSCKYMRGTECMNEVARIRNKIGLKISIIHRKYFFVCEVELSEQINEEMKQKIIGDKGNNQIIKQKAEMIIEDSHNYYKGSSKPKSSFGFLKNRNAFIYI